MNDSGPFGIAALRYGARYRAHQPDFRTIEIADRPDNTDAGGPVLLTADCACGHVGGSRPSSPAPGPPTAGRCTPARPPCTWQNAPYPR